MVGERNDFGSLLKKFRKRAALTQEQLGNSGGWGESYISKLERSDRPPPAGMAERLATALVLDSVDTAALIRAAQDTREADRRLLAGRQRGWLPGLPRSRQPVGRDAIISDIEDSLRSGDRLVGVVGEPGIGKTTVAIEVARRVEELGERIVLWADSREREASSLQDLQAFLSGLLVRRRANTDPESRRRAILLALARRPYLLVIDNLESATDAEEILRFIGSLPDTTAVVVTSRRWLPANLGGRSLPLTELTKDAALTLFSRIGAQLGRVAESEQERQIVNAICGDVLVGHPGAVEIAASLWAAWPLVDILRGLRRKAMETLVAPDRTDINRSMRLSIGLSYDLLGRESGPSYELFPRLSVFQSSFTHQAAHDICAASEILVPLSLLVQRSLVRFDRSRYSLHSVVREFGQEILGDGREEYEQRFIEFYFTFALRYGDDLDRLELEVSNLLEALEKAEARLRFRALAVEFVGNLSTFLQRRGYWEQRTHHLKRTLEIATLAEEDTDIITLSYQLGFAFQDQGENEEAAACYNLGIERSRGVGNAKLEANGQLLLAEVTLREGDVDLARILAEKAAQPLEGTDLWSLAKSLLGSIETAAGDYEKAQEHLLAALQVSREAGDYESEMENLQALAHLARRAMKPDAAESFQREYVDAAIRRGDRAREGEGSLRLGMVLAWRDRIGEANESWEKAAKLLAEERSPRRRILFQEANAMMALWDGRIPEAIELWKSNGAVWRDLENFGAARAAWMEAADYAETFGLLDAARECYRLVLDLLVKLGMGASGEAEEVRRALERLSEQ